MKYTPKFAVITTALAASLAFTACTSSAAPKDAPKDAPKVLTGIAERLVEKGYPGAIITRTSPDGTAETATAGTADLAADTPIPADGEVRIGSASKPFSAVVALQLVEEGLLELDRSVDTYLPGLIKGEGIDPKAITVRQLLQHTSGLPEYTTEVIVNEASADRDIYRSPRDVLDLALGQPAIFPAGERHQYTNTNYIVLGLIIERVTQRPLAEQIHDRIVTPLDLKHTYLPEPGETGLRGEHPLGYHTDAKGELRDVTEYDSSTAWASGAMVSTPAELNTFMKAVLDGELLEPAELDQMLTGIPTGDKIIPGNTYGLGLESSELGAGTTWGHNGYIPGYQTINTVAEDGTAVTITLTALPPAIYDGPLDGLDGPPEEFFDFARLSIDALDEALSTP
ncbi:serine hydrolase domain-containing protein [Arthrobacter zhaoguopingii]|uniref:serine hydrolase domain-containing protein n=1 Tax=Arthrobacter zhaoguopingii TaxID=2681491 RepID=UPI0013581777|nr:serine hydrolase domain-containing protein [Arthrobacter zhaoguopingii]